jgi:hypothetical protein
MVARRPRQDDSVVHKVTPPTLPPPHSQPGPTPPTRDLTVPQMQVQVVHRDFVIPETEADATSNELQWQERRTKSKNDVSWEERLTCDDDEVNGRLKRKKGHQRLQPQEVDLSQKRKTGGPSVRRVPQSQGAFGFGGDAVEFSTDDDEEGEDSEGDLEDTPSFSQLGVRGKESHIDRFLRGSGDEDDRKHSTQKKGKKGPLPIRKNISQRTRSSQRGKP